MRDRRIIGAFVMLVALLPVGLRAQSAEPETSKSWLPDSIAGALSTLTSDAPAEPAKPAAPAASQSPQPDAAKAPAQPESSASAPAAAAPATDGTAASTATTATAPDAAIPQAPPQPPAKKLFGAVKVAAPLTPRVLGTYAKGCLAGGEALPVDGPAWKAMRLSRNRNWAHPKLVALLERFATEMKEQENWPGLLIGDLSQPRGGPMLTGHASHQVGLDADIWFKPLPKDPLPVEARETFEPLLLAPDKGKEVIAANWNDGFASLVKRAASYPEVERIFVHPAIKKKFCEVAGDDKKWLGKVRPMWLHNYHFHVRIACPEGSPGCEKQKAVTGEDGCGKEVDDWIAMVSRPPKPAAPVAPAAKPAPPPKPKPELTLDNLPAGCREVLAAEPGGTAVPIVATASGGAVKTNAAKAAHKTAHASDKKTSSKKASAKRTASEN